jgi:hypothetical protein
MAVDRELQRLIEENHRDEQFAASRRQRLAQEAERAKVLRRGGDPKTKSK